MNTRFLILAVFSLSFAYEGQAQTIYPTPHQVFVDALEHGQAEGELHGEVAAQFTRQFRSTGPLLVCIVVIKRSPQAGCARLEMALTKKDVEMPKGHTDAILKTQLNYCRNGSPPVRLN